MERKACFVFSILLSVGFSIGAQECDPQVVSGLPTTVGIADLDVQGGYAYVGCFDPGGECPVINISNPANPFVVGTFEGAPYGLTTDVKAVGDRLYVTTGDDGHLLIIDISQPSNPETIGRFATSGSANGVALGISNAFVASSVGMQVVDVTNPYEPYEAARLWKGRLTTYV